jgi:hypothetical protein
MCGRIEVRGLFCYSLTELLELTVHEDWISNHSDIGAHDCLFMNTDGSILQSELTPP